MNRTKRGVCTRVLRALATIAIALLGVAALPAAPAIAQQKVALRVAYIPVITWLPALVAKEEGIFEANGLDVTLTKFATLVHLPPTLGRQFDLVPTTAPDFLNAVAGGLNLAAVAGETLETANNKSFQVLVRPDSGLSSPKELTGKRVATPGVGSVMHIALLYWVKQDGGDPRAVAGIEAAFPLMMDMLKSGRVDAVEQLEPFVGQMLAAGFKSLGDPLLAVADPVLFPFWIADADWARANRGVLRKYVTSLEAGLKIIRNDDAKARAVLAKYSGLPEAVIARTPIPAYDFKITPAQIDVWRNMMVSQGFPLSGLDIGRIVVTPE
jgi:NitT/TauT family transport system substrate-binding protein